MGSEFWSGLLDWINNVQLKNNYISEKDLKLFSLTDDPAEAANIICEFHKGKKHTPNF